MMSNASCADPAMPVFIIVPTAPVAVTTSMPKALARSIAVVVTFWSSASEAVDMPEMLSMTACSAALTSSVDAPHAPL